jgi:hypothetical protein
MHQVTRFESTLLKILHAMVGRAPAAQVLKLLVRRWARPRCLSRQCVDLVKDALSKGCTWWLATGGWRSETFLRGDAAAEGRLWQRTPPADLGLEFSAYALDFLIWLTEADVSGDAVWQPYEEDSLATGDRLLLALSLDAVADTEIGMHWAASPPFANDGLCALLHPELMAHAATRFSPTFEPWLTPAGQTILEAAQHRLARSWHALETAKATMISRDRMTALGRAQRQTLHAFFAAIDRAGRRDLARWVLIALEDAVADSPDVSRWIGALDVKGLRVAQRTEIYRSAVAFLAAAAQLSHWQQQAVGTGYFDEGYAASQIWKSDWERYNGQAAIATAQRVARDAEPLVRATSNDQ